MKILNWNGKVTVLSSTFDGELVHCGLMHSKNKVFGKTCDKRCRIELHMQIYISCNNRFVTASMFSFIISRNSIFELTNFVFTLKSTRCNDFHLIASVVSTYSISAQMTYVTRECCISANSHRNIDNRLSEFRLEWENICKWRDTKKKSNWEQTAKRKEIKFSINNDDINQLTQFQLFSSRHDVDTACRNKTSSEFAIHVPHRLWSMCMSLYTLSGITVDTQCRWH